MTERQPSPTDLHTEGLMIHRAGLYDRMISIVTLGGEGKFRRRIVESAGLCAGQRVLDVGCGTGTLALAAVPFVEPDGRVEGIDPSPEMIDRARAKAAAAGVSVQFTRAAIELLPFPDDSFDAVLSSLMFHHLTGALKDSGLAEIRRVLAPGGGLTIVDFAGPGPFFHRLAGRFSRSSSHSEKAGGGGESLELRALRAGFETVRRVRFGRFMFRLSAETGRDG